jgi:hypothetical protein
MPDATDDLIALERAGWQALVEGEGEAFYRDRITDDATLVVPGVVMAASEWVTSIGRTRQWSGFTIDDARRVPIAPGCDAVVYRATGIRDGEAPYHALVTSVYARVDGAWKLALHQQTPV